MKNISKILVTGFICLSTLLFTGCPYLTINGGENWGKKTPEYYEFAAGNEPQFLVKKNYSRSSSVSAQYTGIISNSRNADSDINVINTVIPDYGRKDSELIIKANKEVFASNARAGEDDLIKAGEVQDLSTEDVGDKREFWYITDQNKYTFSKVEFTKKAEGSNCVVWFYENQETLEKLYGNYGNNLNIQPTLGSDGKLICQKKLFSKNFYNASEFITIAQIFDNLISKEEDLFGSHVHTKKFRGYINPQSKIDIIICDLFNDAKLDSTGGTFGYFYALDYMNTSSKIDGKYYSNQRQCIYVDSYWLQMWTKSLYSTIAHEFCHLLNYSQKTMNCGTTFDTWFTEMLAMTAEDYMSGDLLTTSYESPRGRLSNFCFNYNFGYTKWLSGDNTLISYANAFAFGAYLTRNFGGKNFIQTISTNEYGDFKAIDEALKTRISFENDEDAEFYLNNFQYPYYTYVDWNFANVVIEAFIRQYKNKYSITLDENDFYSLHKSVEGFSAIDLNEVITPYQDNNGQVKDFYGPYVLNYKENYDLGPGGFTVYYFSRKVSGFNYTYYDNAPVYPLFY
ncbi:MAG: hypothetical protein K6E97_09005 [Treponema sp.]|nr:hypothetical protein [Treponema sp.]